MTVRLPIAHPESLAPPPKGDGVLLLRVGDLAQRTQKSVRALHLYEELGLLLPIERSKGGFRLYSDDRDKLRDAEAQIERLQQLRDELRSSVSYLEVCDECAPVKAVSSCPECDLHGCGAPELVAGLHGSRHD